MRILDIFDPRTLFSGHTPNLIRYTAVRVLQSIVDTSEEIWYQFILEACARKYQPNKELREKQKNMVS